jgi:hypothetical protein
MASHGVFLVACGYEYDGPRGRLAFAPRLTPEDFRCAFTAAEGWGTFAQQSGPGRQTARVTLRWGSLDLAVLRLGGVAGFVPAQLKVTLDDAAVAAGLHAGDDGAEIRLDRPLRLAAGQTLAVELR